MFQLSGVPYSPNKVNLLSYIKPKTFKVTYSAPKICVLKHLPKV